MDRIIKEIKLRDYQLELANATRAAFARGLKRVLVYGPTGMGKTEVAMYMIANSIKKGRRPLFIANRLELIEQASRRFDAAGIDHGIIQGNHWRTRQACPVQIASIQTLARRGLPETDLIFIDEAHGATAPQYRKLLAAYNNVQVIGLSATPFSKGLGKHYDNLSGALFQEVIATVTPRKLIDLGYLVDCRVFSPSEPDLTGVKMTGGDYDELMLAAATDRPGLIADIVSTWLRLGENRLTVCFAVNIPHSQHIVTEFKKHGIPAEHVDAWTPEEERREIFDRWRRGVTRIVSNVSLLAEGFDLPELGCMIYARPTKSLIRHIQMAGRVLRRFEGKTDALILDHSGSIENLGFPTDEFELTLDTGKSRESKAVQRKEPLPKKCPACAYMKPPKVHACPSCGFAPAKQSDVEVGEGELVETSRKKVKATMEQKRQFFAELEGYRMQKGYARGWTSHKYKEKFGVWPVGMDGVGCTGPTQETLNWLKGMQIRYAKGKAKAQEVNHAAA